MNNVLIGLLTHPNSSYSTKAFTQFISELTENEIDARVIKIFPRIINHDSESNDHSSFFDLCFSIVGFFWIKTMWALRRQQGHRILTHLRVLKFFLDAAFAIMQLCSGKSRKIKKKSNLRLRNITDNHSTILSMGLESEADLIVTFEDDINFRDLSQR